MEKWPIEKLQLNEQNPRKIDKEDLQKLQDSIQDFPKMLEVRPIVVDENGIILGGNMRYRACQALGMVEVPVTVVSGLSEDAKREFIVRDNINNGDWDWEMFAESDYWENVEVSDWGVEVPELEDEPNYELLEDEDLSGQLDRDWETFPSPNPRY